MKIAPSFSHNETLAPDARLLPNFGLAIPHTTSISFRRLILTGLIYCRSNWGIILLHSVSSQALMSCAIRSEDIRSRDIYEILTGCRIETVAYCERESLQSTHLNGRSLILVSGGETSGVDVRQMETVPP